MLANAAQQEDDGGSRDGTQQVQQERVPLRTVGNRCGDRFMNHVKQSLG